MASYIEKISFQFESQSDHLSQKAMKLKVEEWKKSYQINKKYKHALIIFIFLRKRAFLVNCQKKFPAIICIKVPMIL